jgi:hypothetical protein
VYREVVVKKQIKAWALFSLGLHGFVIFGLFLLPQQNKRKKEKDIHSPMVTYVEPMESPNSRPALSKRKGVSGTLKHAAYFRENELKLEKDGLSPSFFHGKKSIEGFAGEHAYDFSFDRKFSKYSILHNRVEGYLTYPSWLLKSAEYGEVRAVIRFSKERDFSITIQSESSLLRVHISKMFRSLILDDLQLTIRQLRPDPIFMKFVFLENLKPEVEMFTKIHENQLFFERGLNNREMPIQLRESNLAAGEKFIELDVSKFFDEKRSPLHLEEYLADPAYREANIVLWGKIT